MSTGFTSQTILKSWCVCGIFPLPKDGRDHFSKMMDLCSEVIDHNTQDLVQENIEILKNSFRKHSTLTNAIMDDIGIHKSMEQRNKEKDGLTYKPRDESLIISLRRAV